MDKFNCNICTADMVSIYEHSVKMPGRSNKLKMRRYSCPICGFKKTIFGSGFNDEELIVVKCNNDLNKFFKKEENNRNFINND